MGERGGVDRNTCHVQTRVGATIQKETKLVRINQTRIRSNRVNREPRSISDIWQRRTESETKAAGKRSCNARSEVAIDRIAGCSKVDTTNTGIDTDEERSMSNLPLTKTSAFQVNVVDKVGSCRVFMRL
ncbi:hypothetical protein MUK42_36849 [Musa troglodytarum]|uniref:Uncharacterized protein n=1 Tax=Musa troglodytarum TaxID=320322 RepID=A0A9E7JXI9_9LILI|nr:hypothetical protein MUK42_36849 [Musa troglodytarum]